LPANRRSSWRKNHLHKQRRMRHEIGGYITDSQISNSLECFG
jgi:hypothetical protein